MDSTNFPSRILPLKTTKQRNVFNRKNHPRPCKGNNSTDDEARPGPSSLPPSFLGGTLPGGDEEGFHRCDPYEQENLTNNDEQSGFVDSENENITERLCSLSRLSINGQAQGQGQCPGPEVDVEGAAGGEPYDATDLSSYSVPISKVRNPSYPSFQESDSVGDKRPSVLQTSTVGEGEEEMIEDSKGRIRRRRRRRGHRTNSKRMAVDTSEQGEMDCQDPESKYSIRPAERPGPSGCVQPRFNKLDKTKAVDPLDSLGNKRKRPVVGTGIIGHGQEVNFETYGMMKEDRMDGIGDDQEMKSEDDDEDYSSIDSGDDSEKEDEDRGREADDEQSDWVFDEWNTSSKESREESAVRKKRLMKMLRSYNDMISSNSSGNGPLSQGYQLLPNREIRAGRRRVHLSKSGFPCKGIYTSANEEVSKFLQDPMQSQIRLPPVSAEESVQLSHLASLYSLRMDYCNNGDEEQAMEDSSRDGGDDENSGLKVFPVLTKTSNTTQMDKVQSDPPASSPLNAEGSSSSNVSSVYCPTTSDIDSRTGDSKRIKK